MARPQGRGKIERFFGTVTTELLPLLPGHLVRGKPATPPGLTLAALDAAFATWLAGYHQRTHSETGLTPTAGWVADGWLPRTTDTPEQLDLLLFMVAAPRVVHRDGIHFQGVRYLDPTLAAYVGERVTIRYDPRDMAEIRVYHLNVFVCRAVSPAHASQTVTLKDIQAARVAHRRALRVQLDRRHAAVREFLPSVGHTAAGTSPPADPLVRPADTTRSETAGPSKPQLFTYQEDVP